jgi:hypothetical protein
VKSIRDLLAGLSCSSFWFVTKGSALMQLQLVLFNSRLLTANLLNSTTTAFSVFSVHRCYEQPVLIRFIHRTVSCASCFWGPSSFSIAASTGVSSSRANPPASSLNISGISCFQDRYCFPTWAFAVAAASRVIRVTLVSSQGSTVITAAFASYWGICSNSCFQGSLGSMRLPLRRQQ